MKYLEYVKTFEGNEQVEFWVTHNLANYLKTNQENQDEIEHILDYLISSDAPTRLKSMSYDEAKTNAEKWTKTQQKKGQHIIEKPEDTEVVLDFKDGFKIVKLVGKAAYEREGYLMRHCVAIYYGKNAEIYSLRDKDNMPHATMEKDQQIKGKGNVNIHLKYVEYVVKFLEYTGMTVGDNEMKHLGYVNMSKFKKELNKETKYFNKIYLPAHEKLIGKDGKEFASLDLWDVMPLVSEENEALKINFELPTFIKLSFEYIKSKTVRGKKTSGNYATNASSGDSATNASSGYYAKNASSGNSAKNASSGYSATNASSGDSATNASSGNYATNASSGDYATNASSGDYAMNASSGDYATNASSGDYATNAMEGNHSVSVDAGHNGQAKGKIGCWFCLSEWKKDTNGIWKPICVKAVQIDGKKIKEDTYYKLVDGKFMEVK